MKKIKKLLLLFILIIPFIVKADMGAPLLDPYEVEVVKEEIDYYEWKNLDKEVSSGTIPKGTTLTTYYTTYNNGEEYLEVEYDKKNVYIKSSDVVAKGELGVKSNAVESTEPAGKIRLEQKVEVRKGPSNAYDVVGTLPAGDYEYTYFLIDPPYIYVESNKIKGWVYKYEEGLSEKALDIIFPLDYKTSCGVVKSGTIFKDNWYKRNGDESGYKVNLELDGCEFEYNTLSGDAAYFYEEYKIFEAKEDLYLNLYPGEPEQTYIEEGEEFTVLSYPFFYKKTDYYYIEYDGENYWLQVDDLYESAEYKKDVKQKDKKKDKDKDKDKKKDKDEDDDEDEDENEIDTSTIVIACVITGISVALATIIIIILINKKRDKKKNETDNK